MSVKFIDIDNIELLQFDLLQSNKLFHFSTTTKGGVGQGTYASFNLGFYSGDDLQNVLTNRSHLANILDVSIDNIFVPHQTHEDQIFIIDETFLKPYDKFRLDKLKGVDALITDQKNICIGITTADCVPILIFDPKKNIFAAIHAGWKGTVAKIATKTVAKMTEHFDSNPNDLLVGIAPCISQERFEVGEEVVEKFINVGFSIKDIAYTNAETGRKHIDLELANKLILHEAGIPNSNIEMANICTYSNPDKFFSARRQSIHSGRMITGGVLR